MMTLRTVAAVRRALAPYRAGGAIGLVPTMGALHEGHAALIRAARAGSGPVVVSLFVNPSQFGDPADLAAYPRQESADEAIAAAAGGDFLFAPTAAAMYPDGFATSIDVGGPALGFEGAARPGHFRGVATVCAKLFAIVRPRLAFFGQKDAQQVAVLRQLVRDLDLEIEIRVVPTVRDADGLALSSRNVRLTPEERRRALAIPRALLAGLAAYGRGGDVADAARGALAGLDVDYAAVARFDGEPVLVVAARVGRTRLIDNVPLEDPARAGLVRERGDRGVHDV
jgi:pantoate--beta-alanine ligase